MLYGYRVKNSFGDIIINWEKYGRNVKLEEHWEKRFSQENQKGWQICFWVHRVQDWLPNDM